MTIIPATKQAIPIPIFSIFILLVLFQLSGEVFSGTCIAQCQSLSQGQRTANGLTHRSSFEVLVEIQTFTVITRRGCVVCNYDRPPFFGNKHGLLAARTNGLMKFHLLPFLLFNYPDVCFQETFLARFSSIQFQAAVSLTSRPKALQR
jgi:hypothetical protein